MFFFFLSSSGLRRRLQVAGGAGSHPKGSEEASGAGASGPADSEGRDAATPAGKFAPLRLSLSGFSTPATHTHFKVLFR